MLLFAVLMIVSVGHIFSAYSMGTFYDPGHSHYSLTQYFCDLSKARSANEQEEPSEPFPVSIPIKKKTEEPWQQVPYRVHGVLKNDTFENAKRAIKALYCRVYWAIKGHAQAKTVPFRIMFSEQPCTTAGMFLLLERDHITFFTRLGVLTFPHCRQKSILKDLLRGIKTCAIQQQDEETKKNISRYFGEISPNSHGRKLYTVTAVGSIAFPFSDMRFNSNKISAPHDLRSNQLARIVQRLKDREKFNNLKPKEVEKEHPEAIESLEPLPLTPDNVVSDDSDKKMHENIKVSLKNIARKVYEFLQPQDEKMLMPQFSSEPHTHKNTFLLSEYGSNILFTKLGNITFACQQAFNKKALMRVVQNFMDKKQPSKVPHNQEEFIEQIFLEPMELEESEAGELEESEPFSLGAFPKRKQNLWQQVPYKVHGILENDTIENAKKAICAISRRTWFKNPDPDSMVPRFYKAPRTSQGMFLFLDGGRITLFTKLGTVLVCYSRGRRLMKDLLKSIRVCSIGNEYNDMNGDIKNYSINNPRSFLWSDSSKRSLYLVTGVEETYFPFPEPKTRIMYDIKASKQEKILIEKLKKYVSIRD